MKAVICATGAEIERQMSRGDLEKIAQNLPEIAVTDHPEAAYLRPYCLGLSTDLGCGAYKIAQHAIGIDLLPAGELGKHGCMDGSKSSADIAADVSDLYFIPDGVLDSVVSRHCFEHLKDPIATMREWLRILRPGGLLSMCLPDDSHHDMMGMDSDHKFRCYPAVISSIMESFKRYGNRGINAEVVDIGTEIQCRWSFFVQIRRLI